MTQITPAKQPAVYAGLGLAAAALAAVFFLHPTHAQIEGVVAAAPVLAGVLGRFFVMPNGKPLGDIIQLRAGQATEAIAEAQAELDAIAKLAAAFAPAAPVVQIPSPVPAVVAPLVVPPAAVPPEIVAVAQSTLNAQIVPASPVPPAVAPFQPSAG